MVAVLLAGMSPSVEAHLVETGFGAFYNGLAHVVLTPPDLLVVFALALLAGQRGALAARWALLALPLAWLLGGALAILVALDGSLSLLTTLTFGVAGALVAFNAKLPAAGVAALSMTVGLLHGYVSGTAMATGGALALAVAGSTATVFCVFAILAAQVTAVEAQWGRIAVRVAGSWVAAAGLLMMGWLARGTV
jgi:hydrogenase/urease accessory protein HupE